MFQVLVYFLCKNSNPQKKIAPFFPGNPPLKIEILSSPLFENLVEDSTLPPSSRKEGGGKGVDMLVSGSQYLVMCFSNKLSNCFSNKASYLLKIWHG